MFRDYCVAESAHVRSLALYLPGGVCGSRLGSRGTQWVLTAQRCQVAPPCA